MVGLFDTFARNRGIPRAFPPNNPPVRKNLDFLNELEEIINVMDEIAFRECCVPLFKHIIECFKSDHFQVFYFLFLFHFLPSLPPTQETLFYVMISFALSYR